MICLQILGGHGACGHEAAEGSRVGVRCAGHGGEPREICEEGGDCGEGVESAARGGGARGAREDGEAAGSSRRSLEAYVQSPPQTLRAASDLQTL
jgi:hypothetical protein